jgi:hypothetical protein
VRSGLVCPILRTRFIIGVAQCLSLVRSWQTGRCRKSSNLLFGGFARNYGLRDYYVGAREVEECIEYADEF